MEKKKAGESRTRMTDFRHETVFGEETFSSGGTGGTGVANQSLIELRQDENVLQEVLDELDRERTRRAELESVVRRMMDEKTILDSENKALRLQQQEHEQLIKKLQQEKIGTADTVADPKRIGKEIFPQPFGEEKEITRRAFLSMEAQVRDYKTLIDALTMGRPAIAAAAKQDSALAISKQRLKANPQKRSTTLPLYVVRLLEILPWTPHASEHVFAKETIFEFQHYDSREKRWMSQVKGFPQYFKTLPVVRTTSASGYGIIGDYEGGSGKSDGRGLLVFLAGGGANKSNSHAPLNQGVLTNEDMTQILSIEEGYPLPDDGAKWEWIGGWRIEKRATVTKTTSLPTQPLVTSGLGLSTRQKIDCDEEGWSYAEQAEHFKVNPTEWVWDNPGEQVAEDGARAAGKTNTSDKQSFLRRLRRRKWTRQRVLVDYPHACEFTRQYLKLVAENARLTVTTNKISDQLVETKTALTENEELLMNERSDAAVTIARLTNEVTQLRKNGKHQLNDEGQNQNHNNPIQEFLQKNEQVKGIQSKLQKWVASRGRSDSKDLEYRSQTDSTDLTSSGGKPQKLAQEPEVETLSSIPPSALEGPPRESSMNLGGVGGFDWKKVGSGNFFEKLKTLKDGKKDDANDDTNSLNNKAG